MAKGKRIKIEVKVKRQTLRRLRFEVEGRGAESS